MLCYVKWTEFLRDVIYIWWTPNSLELFHHTVLSTLGFYVLNLHTCICALPLVSNILQPEQLIYIVIFWGACVFCQGSNERNSLSHALRFPRYQLTNVVRRVSGHVL